MIKHDVVVIGGGLAGMRAAVEAAERGADVAIVSKMHPVRSHSGAAQGGINAALGNTADDTPENHAFDTAKGSDYLGDQDAIEAMCDDAPRQIIWLEHRGCIFSRLPDGRLAQRPFGGAGSPRTCYSADVTGLVILHTLWEQLERFKVKVYEEYFCTALCVEDGVGTGVVAYNMRNGELELITAKATILATGGCGRMYAKTTNGYASTDDVKAANGAHNDLGFGQHPGFLDRLVDDQGVSRSRMIHHHAFLNGGALYVNDAIVRVDVLRTIRTGITMGAQPKIILIDLR